MVYRRERLDSIQTSCQDLTALSHYRKRCTKSSSSFRTLAHKMLQSCQLVNSESNLLEHDAMTFLLCRSRAGMGDTTCLRITHLYPHTSQDMRD
jgi:hypothetical protein